MSSPTKSSEGARVIPPNAEAVEAALKRADDLRPYFMKGSENMTEGDENHVLFLAAEVRRLRLALADLCATSVAGKDGYFKAKEKAQSILGAIPR